jgi:phage terminase large subunit
MSSLTLDLPEKIAGAIFGPKRYKIFYGGRGGAKSWSLARALLVMAASKQMRILCAREIQKSIKDSVHQLLRDQINELGLSDFYQVLATEIRGRNGSQFAFTGLRHNSTEIKSHEGADVCWVEEAQSVSPSSWKVLIPTIRKDGSEIWVSFNPDLEDDETYQRFVMRPPKESTVVKVNWSDNPWFPDVLKMEKDELRERSYDEYLHVWEGNCRETLEGAVYAEEMRKAKEEERITVVPVDHSKPVDVFFDLGWADCTSMWFVQTVGKEIRVVDFYQNQLQKIQHYAQLLQNKGYVYGKMFLPHDAFNNQLSGKNTDQALRDLGFKTQRVEKLGIQEGIQAARTLFPSLWFDAGRCSDGLQALKKYRYDVDPDTGKWSKEPLHDENSHAADAFRYLAVGYRPPIKKVTTSGRERGGWMSL